VTAQLPEGWAWATVDDLGDYLNGMAFKPEDWTPSGMPIIRIQNLTDASKPLNRTERAFDERYRVVAGDLLVSWSATLDAFIWQRGDAILNQHIFKVTPSGAVDARFLYYALKEAIAELAGSEHLHGSTMKHINRGPFLAHALPLPPVAEQRRIVAKLDQVMARTARARVELARIPALIAQHKRAILEAAFDGELTAEWRSALGLPAPSQHALADVAVGFSYGTSARSSDAGTVPVLRMGNIQDGKLEWTDLVFTSDQAEIAKYRLMPGDVLFNRTNSPELVGKAAVYKGEREAIYAGYLIRISCGPNLDSDYLNYCLGSPTGREYCWRVKSDGVSQSNINAKKLGAFVLRVPTMEEQREIVRRIESAFAWLDKVAHEHAQATRLLDHLDQALLAKAFRGELVPQDPADEPAATLLARIRAEREAVTPVARKRKARP